MFIFIIMFSIHNIIFIIMFSVFMFISVRGFGVICVNSRSNRLGLDNKNANNKNYVLFSPITTVHLHSQVHALLIDNRIYHD